MEGTESRVFLPRSHNALSNRAVYYGLGRYQSQTGTSCNDMTVKKYATETFASTPSSIIRRSMSFEKKIKNWKKWTLKVYGCVSWGMQFVDSIYYLSLERP
jgi:hypothetical protein